MQLYKKTDHLKQNLIKNPVFAEYFLLTIRAGQWNKLIGQDSGVYSKKELSLLKKTKSSLNEITYDHTKQLVLI